MLQGHIFVFWGKEYVTQKKGRTPENVCLDLFLLVHGGKDKYLINTYGYFYVNNSCIKCYIIKVY
mgnify:CR=1 FL=1